MIEKISLSTSLGYSDGGSRPIYFAEDEKGEKVACIDQLLPSVRSFLASVCPEPDTRYLLVNAMGAYEYWGPNSNHDAWPEAALAHLPKEWTGNPIFDKPLVQRVNWPYGLPTFYFAHAFPHHRNKDPKKKIGDVVLSVWNDIMKRVELVLRIEKRLCQEQGCLDFWSMMENGDFPAVSMGSKVPWDRCSVSTDMDEFYRALSSFNPAEHAHPGIAVLRWHERLIRERGHGIRGIARTRAEYGPLMRYHAGQIDQKSGKLIFVYNDFPRFFDISLVRRGADKTAYTMISLAHGESLSKVASTESGVTLREAQKKIKGRAARSLEEVLSQSSGGSTLEEADRLYHRTPLEIPAEYLKCASKLDFLIHHAGSPPPQNRAIELAPMEPFYKEAEMVVEASSRIKRAYQRKKGEIVKDVDAVVTHVTKGESDLPKETLEEMAQHEPEKALGTAASLGIVLRPREFTRMCLCRVMGPSYGDLADRIDLPIMPPAPPLGMGILPRLLSLLMPFFGMRSGFHEPLSSRVSVVIVAPQRKPNWESSLLETSLPNGFLDKLGSLYQSYRSGLMTFVPQAPYLLEGVPEAKVAFLHQSDPFDLFTPLSARYFQVAFLDELSR